MQADGGISRQKILLTPSTCCESAENWRITDVLNAGLLTTFGSAISHLAVQRYPEGKHSNCDGGLQSVLIEMLSANCPPTAPQATDQWPRYLRHDEFVTNIFTNPTIGYEVAAGTSSYSDFLMWVWYE